MPEQEKLTQENVYGIIRSVALNVCTDPTGREMAWVGFTRPLTDDEVELFDGVRVPDHDDEMYIYRPTREEGVMATRDEVVLQRAELDRLLEDEATLRVERHLQFCIDANSVLNRMMSRMIRAMRIAGIDNRTILAVMADEGRIEAADKERYGR